MRKNRFGSGNIGSAVVTNLAHAISEIVPRHFGERRNAAKHLARMSGASERAAKNWLSGRNTMQLDNAIRLAAECEEFCADLLALIEMSKAKVK